VVKDTEHLLHSALSMLPLQAAEMESEALLVFLQNVIFFSCSITLLLAKCFKPCLISACCLMKHCLLN